MGLLTGKTAIITGAARGIGKAIALKFAAEGCPEILAEVETIAFLKRKHNCLEKDSFVTLMPTLPSSANKLGARLRAPS